MVELCNVEKKYRKMRIGRIVIPKDAALLVCLSILIYVYCIGFFTFNFGVPETSYYVTDVLIVMGVIISIKKIFKVFFDKRLKLFTFLLFLMVVVCTGSALSNEFNPILWMWSFRNWGRFFIYFYICVAVLSEKWINRILGTTIIFFHVNTIVITFQYLFFTGLTQDELNGLVGRNTSGANIMLIMATSIIVSSEYIAKKGSVKKLILVYLEILYISILAELKAIILFSLLIFGFILLINSRLTVRHIIKFISILFIGIIAALIGLNLLAKVYPQFAEIMSIRGFVGAVTSKEGYGNTGYIDRLTAIKVVNRDIFRNGILQHMFGIGMGNAEYSTVTILTSSFYKTYGLLYRYLGFCVAILYIEGGYIGFGLYVTLFVVLIAKYSKRIKRLKSVKKMETSCYNESIGMGMACLGFIFIWYNNLLRTDMSVIIAFYMAIPFAITRKGEKNIG